MAYSSNSCYSRKSTGSVCLNGAVHWLIQKHKVIVIIMLKCRDYADEDNDDCYGRIADSYCRRSAVVVEVGGCLFGCVF
ncbi:hypothetical protein L3X38_030824 [Prunus dulcis]|uniref:Uncharacterized protein n=1 Tax=Prunus dulcis TaxID=3755 RepID=A0AAD4VBD0_PRUDU|nr:hypothetical protein L3X38_030824 [Prunus dulcis]